ncbi:MAG: hypothetical protein WAW15_02165 [Minisyncoccales bacterium]
MNQKQKGFAPIIIVLIVLVLAGVGGTSYYLINKQLTKQTACIMDVKICPDGSSVGRISPNCEFAACPEEVGETVDWLIYTNEKFGYEIKYPSNYSLFQGTNQVTAKVIPADLNSFKIFITDKVEMFFCCEPSYISVEILDTYFTDLEKYVFDNKIINSENSYRVKNKGYVDFNGEQSYRIQSDHGMDSPGNIIIVNHNLKTYYIKDNSLPLSEKIMNTFEFIKN